MFSTATLVFTNVSPKIREAKQMAQSDFIVSIYTPTLPIFISINTSHTSAYNNMHNFAVNNRVTIGSIELKKNVRNEWTFRCDFFFSLILLVYFWCDCWNFHFESVESWLQIERCLNVNAKLKTLWIIYLVISWFSVIGELAKDIKSIVGIWDNFEENTGNCLQNLLQ
jgi:hypothetical protein